MYKVMVVDDQSISRQLFELYIEKSNDFKLTFSVPSASVADIYLLKEKVDIVIMDIFMNDGSNGISAAAKIKKLYPEIKIVVVTSIPEPSLIEKAREAGIDSFWHKESNSDVILNVMRRTMKGESVYPDNLPPLKLGKAYLSDLTDREFEVLKYTTTGATNAEVAEKLFISENTVKKHISNMLSKTELKSRTELAIKARVLGITVLEEE